MIYPRPKLTIFAEAAKTGEVINFPDWARGWGITLEQTNSKPPMEWMNDAIKQLNTHSLYLLQNGGYEWDKALEYPVGAKVQLNNLIYIAKVKNTNINPANNAATWQVYGLQQSDISQLLDGTSKVKVASEDALRRVNLTAEKGVADAKVAKDKADLVGIQANQNTQNLNNKVSKSGDTMTGDLMISGSRYPAITIKSSESSYHVGIQSGPANDMVFYEKSPSGETTYSITVPKRSGEMALTSALIGYGQVWVNVTSNRVGGVNYTNSTAKPIMALISINDVTGSDKVRITVGGVVVFDYDIGGYAHAYSFIVPPGGTYRIDTGANILLRWSELR